ncbi:hypothetical protein CYMTET_32954 [Cymbomonas tetramitiformis]|uniref:OTU domain-containing protein n=1 Tax=Cymbomonas tetramitiformis TaxID=36881 RepID=A0AAE0FE24_9CHLO|nr:hypothetical protein CYMTET_32954 [Cymbomonas tetramitiformis]
MRMEYSDKEHHEFHLHIDFRFFQSQDDMYTTSNSSYGAFWKGRSNPPQRPVSLAPKVNSGSSIQTVKSALAPPTTFPDRQNLQSKMNAYAMQERLVAGDGNCQFRALADQLFGDSEQYAFVRQAVVEQLQKTPTRYCAYVPGSYERYIIDMSEEGCWGDHVTLKACADFFGIKIYLLTSYTTNDVVEVLPEEIRIPDGVLWLSFWAEVHYNSLVPK